MVSDCIVTVVHFQRVAARSIPDDLDDLIVMHFGE